MRRRSSKTEISHCGYGNLEERQLLAFDFLFDGSTLTLNQTVDDGVMMIDNSGPANEFQVVDGAGLVTYETADHLVVNLLDNSSHLTVSLNSHHSGDLTLQAGDGARNILFASAGNTMDGHLSISAGTGSQSLSLAQVSGLQVGGSVNLDTGTGSDSLEFINGLTVGGDFNLSNINTVNFADSFDVAGDVLVDNTGEAWLSEFRKDNNSPSSIGGRFTYFGSGAVDSVWLEYVNVGGDLNVFLEDGFTAGVESQFFVLHEVLFNNLVYQSGDTSNFDQTSFFSTSIAGSVSADMGEGNNTASFIGKFQGPNFNYWGGSGSDSVIYEMLGGSGQQLTVSLGDGNDTFVLMEPQTVDNLDINFGPGNDTFSHNENRFDFDVQFSNLDDFDIDYDFSNDTLAMTQVLDADNANFSLMSNNLSEQFSFAGNPLTTATNLNVNMADDNLGSLSLFLEHILQGDLNVDVGNGDRMIDFGGAANQVVGEFHFSSGEGSQEFIIDLAAGFVAGSGATIDLGTGMDSFTVDNSFLIDQSLNLTNANQILINGTLTALGDFHVDVSLDNQSLEFNAFDKIAIAGDMRVTGNDQHREHVSLVTAAASVIEGNFHADFGDNLSGINNQSVVIGGNMVLGGNVSMLANNELTIDRFKTLNNSQVAGDVSISLGGGLNSAEFRHENIGEGMLQYIGGDLFDQVGLETPGIPNSYNIVLGESSDLFVLEPATAISDMLRVDFGGGADLFDNNMGVFNTDTRLLNLQGFNNFYDPATDSLRLFQTSETLDFSIGNDGPVDAFQVEFLDGKGYELTPASNLRLHLNPNTTTNMEVNLNKSLAGNLVLHLGQAEHEVHFIGTDNSIDGGMFIQGGLGNQTLYLAENQDLTVKATSMINLREGHDSLIDSGNSVHFEGSLILRNVDHYEVTSNLRIDENFSMTSHWYTQDVRFDNDGVLEVGGKFIYRGSDGADQVILGGNTTITDSINIQLGENTTPGRNQTVAMNNGFEAGSRVAITGGSSTGGNIVLTDSTTVIGGNVLVNFSGSNTSNTAFLKGQYAGDYGTFRGGNVADSLVFDADAEDMFWGTIMNDGDDEVTLDGASNLLSTFIDFGFGDDLFNDNTVEEFPTQVENLP